MNPFLPRHRIVRSDLALLALLLTCRMPYAFGQETKPDAPDKCVVELSLPAGATVAIDGQDFGAERRLEWSQLKPGGSYSSALRITFPDGSQEDHSLLLEAGRKIALASLGPAAKTPELVLDSGHRADPKCLALSSDGRYAITGGEDSVAILWDVPSGRKIRDFRGHTRPVTSVSFSPDGRHALTAQDQGYAALWDLTTGRKLRQLGNRTNSNAVAIFSPDGRWVLSNEHDDRQHTYATLWDKETGAQVSAFDTSCSINCMAFSPDGRTIAMNGNDPATRDHPVALWDVTTRQQRLLRGHTANVYAVAFHPGGQFLLSGADDGKAILWAIASGTPIHTFEVSPDDSKSGLFRRIEEVAFSPDGRRVLTMTYLSLVVWNVATKEKRRSFSGPHFHAAQFTMDDKSQVAALIWAGNSNMRVRLYDADTGESTASWRLQEQWAFPQPVRAAVSHDARHIAIVGGETRDCMLFDARAGRLAARLGHENMDMSFAAFSADDRLLLTGGDGRVVLWDVATGKTLNVYSPLDGRVGSLDISADGKHVLTSDLNRTAVLWDRATAKLIRTFEQSNGVNTAAFSPDGRRVLARHGLWEAVLWDTLTGEKVFTLPANDGYLECVAFSADGQRVATGHGRLREGKVILWDANTGARLRALEGHEDQVGSVVFSSDGRYVVTGSEDGTAMLWDSATSVRLRTFIGHGDHVTSVSLTADGERLVTGSRDGTARVWDVRTGLEILRFVNHGDYVRRPAPGPWGPLGNALGNALGLANETREWETNWIATTPQGFFDGSAGGRQKVMFRVPGGLNVVPVDRFFQDFYYPGLLAAIWRGERPLPQVEMGRSLPPRIRIVGPKQGGTLETQQVTLKVEATDEGGGVRGPWLMHNGAQLCASGTASREGKVLRRTFAVTLVEGDNHLEVRAASADGSWESEPARIAFCYQRPQPKPELYLVAVGINRYPEEPMRLRYAVPDAQAITELFRHRGPALYHQVHLTTLTDEQATRAGIRSGVARAAEQARPQDTLAVFLAGHGALAGREYFFLPQEFRRQAERLEEDVRRQGLSATELGEAVAAASALKRMVIFDTGQSGGPIGLVRTARDPFALRGAVERLSRANGHFMLASAAVSETAQEVPELRHGVLTYSLLAGLRAAEGGPLNSQWVQPAGGDQVAHVLEWFGFAGAHLPRLTREFFGQEQEVQIGGSGGMSFPVLPVPPGGAPIAVAEAAAPPRQPAVAAKSGVTRTGTSKERLFLVAVGIDRYAEQTMNLRFASADARAVVELFRQRGGRLFGEVHVRVLLNERATRATIPQAVEELVGRMRPEDVLVVFLSGHGRMVGQRYYLVPAEFRRRAASLEEDVAQQGLAADVLGDALAKAPAGRRVLIFDTCASGGALSISRTGRDAFAFRGAIEKLGQGRAVFTIAASAAGGEAQEIAELEHGVLTYTLLAGVRAAASGPLGDQGIQPTRADGMADVLEWFSFASGHVPRLTKRYLGQEQEVQIAGQGTSFPVLPVREE